MTQTTNNPAAPATSQPPAATQPAAVQPAKDEAVKVAIAEKK